MEFDGVCVLANALTVATRLELVTSVDCWLTSSSVVAVVVVLGVWASVNVETMATRLDSPSVSGLDVEIGVVEIGEMGRWV